LQIAWVLAGCGLAVLALRRKKPSEMNFGPILVAPVVVVAWLIGGATRDPLISSLLMNAFGLGLGIFTLLRGVRLGSVSEANFGMLIITALAVARFFDSEFEFLVRGIGFIAIGAGFLITNMIVFRRKARP
jgi:hypothetical protein